MGVIFDFFQILGIVLVVIDRLIVWVIGRRQMSVESFMNLIEMSSASRAVLAFMLVIISCISGSWASEKLKLFVFCVCSRFILVSSVLGRDFLPTSAKYLFSLSGSISIVWSFFDFLFRISLNFSHFSFGVLHFSSFSRLLECSAFLTSFLTSFFKSLIFLVLS